MSTTAARPQPTQQPLPGWNRVLAVVAHPDDESFGLGGVVARFTEAGADVSVLCLTRGEASTLGDDHDDLAAVREHELATAAAALGTTATTLLSRPDGLLADVPAADLAADLDAAVAAYAPDGLLVFDPAGGVTGHPDHAAASRAALDAADRHRLPVLGWALPAGVAATLRDEYGPGFVGYDAGDLHVTIPVDRERQRRAIAAHASQAVPGSVLWRRLELLGGREHLRWLRRPADLTSRTTHHP